MASSNCRNYVECMQEKLESPMPWVGMYIAAASAACTIAMAADAFKGLRSKKLWFPCKYFSLNAFSLTVLAVAMKLPVDLTSRMLGVNDRLARVSSLVLMSTAMANFMTSLGSMENNEIMLNLAASGILVITISGNICINIFQVRHYYAAKLTLGEKIVSTVFMLLLLVIFCSTAVMVPMAKRYIESQYNQMHKRISNERLVKGHGNFTTDELRLAVRRYWMMAESGSPQFVIARSVTCVTSGVMCLLMALTLFEAHVRLPLEYITLSQNSSIYKWSTSWILVIQSIGVALGTIAPLLRWFTAAQFKSTMIGHKSFRDEFKVEVYWTQSLKHWRDGPLPLKTGLHHKFRKFLHDAKRLLLNLCIGVQILIVLASKLVLLFSATCVKGLMFCRSEETDEFQSRAGNGMEMDFSRCVLRLEGEAELPKRTLSNICNEVDKLIQMGKKKRSKNLIKLLRKSVNFNGVREFDSSEIKSLIDSQFDPPNCWSLPVVTLTSIAMSLPNITDQKSEQLLSAVGEGLYFAKLIEKTVDTNGDLTSIRDAADVVWVGVELYRKWLDKDLQKAGRTHKETLQKLSNVAEKTVTSFTTDTDNFLVQDPLNWPAKVIAANSMYRITQTILLAHKDDNDQTDNEMFERLSIMISDILAACLTNLGRVIRLKCHSNAIKEREKSIRQAALLLGESEEILEILKQRDELPNLDPEKAAASIQGWRAFMEQDIENPVASVSETFSQTLGVGDVSIEMDR
ncbi:hypothetical protein PHJA_000892000 [Phtheirospermum japonicum]|uniref:Uncharacterized protein n=1 Tax=Phtheirospermum japonicum TaxID=374723 RepID=A0A830BU38_9LAMI|nr:hypothetical protein PHJA_000892000 [Phtheirospermum japonicum]